MLTHKHTKKKKNNKKKRSNKRPPPRLGPRSLSNKRVPCLFSPSNSAELQAKASY